MRKKVVIVDYGLGNLYSISQACRYLGYQPVVSSDKHEILGCDCLILPGVGAFEVAMNQLTELGLISILKDFADSGRPVMGVCLGMQLLFDVSHEFGINNGLGIIPGEVKKIPSSLNEIQIRIPHIGWNKLVSSFNSWENTPLKDVLESDFMYFVHSYFAFPASESHILSYTFYNGFKYCSSVRKNNIFGFQFHPEKSAQAGLSIYENFLNL